MKDSKVSYRYASSLLDNAVEKNNLDVIASDMDLIANTLKGNNELRLMLKNPVIKTQVKSNIIEQIFKERINSDSLNFLKFIIDKNREMILIDIVSKFLEMKDEHLGILHVEVSTAADFTEEQKEDLRKILESKFNKKIRFSFKIDNTVIGGFIAKIADTLYDASIRHQLEILKKQFLLGNVSLN